MQADVEQELNEVRGDCRVLEAERDKACADRQQVQAELSDLQKRLNEAEQNGTPVPDLRGKVGDITSFFKTLLAKDTKLVKDIKQDKDVKLPKDTISKIEEILGGSDG